MADACNSLPTIARLVDTSTSDTRWHGCMRRRSSGKPSRPKCQAETCGRVPENATATYGDLSSGRWHTKSAIGCYPTIWSEQERLWIPHHQQKRSCGMRSRVWKSLWRYVSGGRVRVAARRRRTRKTRRRTREIYALKVVLRLRKGCATGSSDYCLSLMTVSY